MCGIIGIAGKSPVVQDIYDGLMVLQHRGQDSAGIMTYDGHFHLKKGNGLVRDVFDQKNIVRLHGVMGIGHARYTTAGSHDATEEAQPFYTNAPFGIALIHNGNLTNYDALKHELVSQNRRFLNTQSDSEVLLHVLADELQRRRKNKLSPDDFFLAMKRVFGRLKGSYSVIAMVAGHGMLAFRDPLGIRPLMLGKRDTKLGTEYVLASESVAMDMIGYERVRDVRPGEVAFINLAGELFLKQVLKPNYRPCIFEYVYIARPDSVIDNIGVHKARIRMGEHLAKQIRKAKLPIDIITCVPDSARTAAIAIAASLGIPYREGLVKNRYIGRTFIMPGQRMRKRSIHHKLNPVPFEIRKKNVLLVDDSIVRGNTSRRIIEMVRDAGARKVYFASAAPMMKSPCVYGVDLPSRKEFIAYHLNVEQIRKAIGADALFYQTIPDLIDAVKHGKSEVTAFCHACMSGKYPTKEVTPQLLKRVEQARTKVLEEEDAREGQMVLL